MARMSIRRPVPVVLVLFVASLAACGSQSPSEPGLEAGPVGINTRPASVVVSPDSVMLRVGRTVQLTAVVYDARGVPIPGAPIQWIAVNPAVASVSAQGLVTANGLGSTIVGARSGRASDKIPVVVTNEPPLDVSATVPLGGCPYGVALAANGTGYVTQFCGNSVTRFDVAGPTLGGAVPVGSFPPHVGMSPDGATAYVINQLSSSVMVLDVASNTVTDEISLGPFREAYNVLVSPDGAWVYLTTNDGVVFAMNAATHVLEDTAAVGAAANGLALHPTEPRLYVSSILAATVTAINTNTFDVERVYGVGGQLQRIAVAPSGEELYAANFGSMSIVNLESGDLTSVPLGAEAIGLAMTAAGDFVYVSLWALGKVAVVDVADRTVFGYVETGGDPRNIAIGADGTVVIANQSGWFDVVR